MIGTIRKHQTWLWGVIIAATIVSFVWFFNPSSRYGGGGGGESRPNETGASIEGRPITVDEFNDAVREEILFYFLQHGEFPNTEKLRQSNYQLDARAYQRIALNVKADELGIHPTAKAAARMTEQIFGVKPGDTVSAADLQRFEQRTLMPNRLTLEDFARFARHQAANQELVSLFGMSGKLITPKETESFYRRENEPMVMQIAFFPVSNYLSQVSAPLADVEKFYTNNRAYYRIPERVQVQYVLFQNSNFLAEADKQMASNTNLSKQIDAVYQQASADAFKDDKGTPLSPDAAKAKIKENERQRQAAVLAQKKAYEFAQKLADKHDEKNPFTTNDLPAAAKAQNLNVTVTEPFDGRTGPKELKPTEAFMRAAFTIRSDDPEDKANSMMYAPPIPVENGWVVMGLLKRFQSQDQTFVQVQSKVMEDYKKVKALDLAKAAGQRFDAALATGLAQGKSFHSLCAAEKVPVSTLAPMSLASAQPTNVENTVEFKEIQKSSPEVANLITNRQGFELLITTTYPLQTGKASAFTPTPDGGFISYIKARLPVDQAKMAKELPDFTARMREQRQSAAFSEWFQRQLQEMRLSVPQQQQQQQQQQKQPMS